MAHAIGRDDPEHVILVLNRNRQLKTYGVLGGLILALALLLLATAAMYSEDPAARVREIPTK